MDRIERLDFDAPTFTLDEWTELLTVNALRVREQRIQALLQPKPSWLPTRVWHWLLSQILVIVELPPDTP